MELIESKKIITTNKNKNWFGTDFTLNAYRGCNHGCIYCDSMSECYNDKNFSTVKAKKDVVEKVHSELSSKRKKGTICTGAMSDPYNSFEKKYEFTRDILEQIYINSFGVFLMTKSDLVIRDIDILQKINKNNCAAVAITITTFDDNLAKIIEPNVSSSSDRFLAIKKLSDEGINAGILMMPILPFINDTVWNIENIVKRAKEVGAKFIYPSFGVTLRDVQRDYFYDSLDKNFIGLKDKYIKLYRNDYNCQSVDYKMLKQHFEKLCKENNILYKMKDIILFLENEQISQLSLF